MVDEQVECSLCVYTGSGMKVVLSKVIVCGLVSALSADRIGRVDKAGCLTRLIGS